MKRKLAITVMIAAFMLFLSPIRAMAVNTGKEACEGHVGDPDYEMLCGGGGESDLLSNVANILNVIFGIIGVIAVIMIIIGGVKYMTSSGDPGKVQSAKNTIMYAIIGLIITLSAFAITNFILGALKG